MSQRARIKVIGNKAKCGKKEYKFTGKNLPVGIPFKRLLGFAHSELGSESADRIGLSDSQLLGYKTAETGGMHISTVLVVLIHSEMNLKDFGIEQNGTWAEDPEAILKEIGWKPNRTRSLKKRLGKSWNGIVERANAKTTTPVADREIQYLARKMRELITTLVLEPGARIDELSLADRYDRKPSTIRLALDQLVAETLIKKSSGHYEVRTVSKKEGLELLSLREPIEMWLLKEATLTSSRLKNTVKSLEIHQNEMRKAKQGKKTAGFIEADIGFHVTLAGGRQFTRHFLSSMVSILRVTCYKSYQRNKGLMDLALEEHDAILLPLKKHGIKGRDEAIAALRKHIKSSQTVHF